MTRFSKAFHLCEPCNGIAEALAAVEEVYGFLQYLQKVAPLFPSSPHSGHIGFAEAFDFCRKDKGSAEAFAEVEEGASPVGDGDGLRGVGGADPGGFLPKSRFQ